MAADVVEQAAEVCLVGGQNAKQRVVAHRGDHSIASFLLDERDSHRALAGGFTNLIGRGNDSGHSRCQTLGVQIDSRLAVDEKAVAAEHYYGLDPGASSYGDGEVANGRHQAPLEDFANLIIAGNLVNRIRLNCHELQGIIENRDGSVVPLPLMQVMNSRKLASALVACASILTACDDPNLLQAQLPTVSDVYDVFALTGTPAAYPSGINTYVRTTARVDGNANFDVAFDIDAQGKVIVYPVQKVVTSLTSSRRVGLRRVPGTFESVDLAPSGTYADSALVADPGEVIIIQAARNGINDACQFNISPFIYTKMTVDSISLASRAIRVQTVLDPNYGFRSFASGIPTR